jgi:hypothetical protein
VRVIADTSSFNASFNSLPTSRGVSAAPVLAPQAYAAPTLNRAGVNATSAADAPVNLGTGTVNVTVQAGLGDPDAIARRVRDVLDRRDRRTGGIAI